MWRLFDTWIFGRLGEFRERIFNDTELTTIASGNLELLQDLVDALRKREGNRVELEALRAELLEAYESVASLVVDLEFERARASYLEERVAEFEDDIVGARRAHPALRIVSVNGEPVKP
ncbi:hypothetical protein mvi_49370 [Methylobacterium indicum]|uniref:Uncharacterized protein n=2 Tax=Methylobacterium indicum TaxID=1775910 RepID=A0A8H9C979_9HYPH|nr:hypothetical protein mvi_49370 [Methylobacterium indicum]